MFFKKKVDNYDLQKEVDVLRAKLKLFETDLDNMRGMINRKLSGRKPKKEEEEKEKDKKEFTLLDEHGNTIIS